MTTPAEETIEAYRAAVIAYRKAFKEERDKHGEVKMNPHVAKAAARDAVMEVPCRSVAAAASGDRLGRASALALVLEGCFRDRGLRGRNGYDPFLEGSERIGPFPPCAPGEDLASSRNDPRRRYGKNLRDDLSKCNS